MLKLVVSKARECESTMYIMGTHRMQEGTEQYFEFVGNVAVVNVEIVFKVG